MTQASNVDDPPTTTVEDGTVLAELGEHLGFRISQENGQRKVGPPEDWTGPPPPKGCEIFVGKLPRDMLEAQLIPIFQKVGTVYEMRIMMDFTTMNNRGYAFVMYSVPEEAKKAVKELDKFEVRKGRFIGVCKSVDNCRLFVGGIPKSKTKEEILVEMRKVTDSVADVILYSSIPDKSKNRGFAFVEYDTHKTAAMARRKLMQSRLQLWGHDIAVDWAEPEHEVDEVIMSKVTVLYVRNLMLETTEETIKDLFSLGGTLNTEKVKKLRDFAFVHYQTRDDAETALNQLDNTELEGSSIEVTWAKPVDKSTRYNYNRQSPNVRPIGPPAVHAYGSYLYAVDQYPFQPTPSRDGGVQRLPLTRRARGAAGVRRFRNYHPSACRRPLPLELPVTAFQSYYSQQYPPSSKVNRSTEDGKTYSNADYPLYVSASPHVDGYESAIAAVPGFPALPARLQSHFFVPVPANFEDGGFFYPPPNAMSMPYS